MAMKVCKLPVGVNILCLTLILWVPKNVASCLAITVAVAYMNRCWYSVARMLLRK